MDAVILILLTPCYEVKLHSLLKLNLKHNMAKTYCGKLGENAIVSPNRLLTPREDWCRRAADSVTWARPAAGGSSCCG